MAKRILAAAACLCLGTALTAADADGPRLTEQTYEKWRDMILPSAKEGAWAKIPWRGSFWEGLVEAQKVDKPILLWSYGGDPLGNC